MGEHWLLLRGLGRERAHWGEFPRHLQRAVGSDTVLTLDLPGTGSQRSRPAPLSIAETSEDVLRQLRQHAGPNTTDLSIGRLFIFGISLGGMVALELSRQLGPVVAGIVVCNTSVAECSPLERMRPRAVPHVLSALLQRDVHAREAAILDLTSSRGHADAVHLARCVEASMARPASRVTVLRQLVAASRFPLPPTLPAPLLVLSSGGDRLVHPRCSERIAAHYRAQHKIHPSAGHDLPLDDPEWVCAQVSAFSQSLVRVTAVSAG